MTDSQYVVWFDELRLTDVNRVGGKNASLGEMISQLQRRVLDPAVLQRPPMLIAIFYAQGGLAQRIETDARPAGYGRCQGTGRDGDRDPGLDSGDAIAAALEEGNSWRLRENAAGSGDPVDISVAVRSSATAEDLANASFAGQQETYLNIHGLDNLLKAIKAVFASLYNDRAISYRVDKGFIHSEVALSAGVQRMVRSDMGASGVIFTLDTEIRI